ncbi:MerR family transcriptional regulator [Promicromonospora sp. MEB111]|uniref:MerR family transcriptional regulator n=1 Tax=Promicromonospora sp. MEB111 TaxID=3040301 RepID=UPI002550E7AE|nr:MerR family transcriptional regulator [Promicromonospora sp. MEB111]
MTYASATDAVPPDGLTVGGAASVVGVTVRTLHHWDETGLARPSQRTTGGHRLYDAADVARLHRVRLYRELGLPVADIAALLDAPTDDAEQSLRRQRDEVREHIARLQRSADALDRMIEARRSGVLLSAEEQVAIFGAAWQPSWPVQARERWGDSEQWAQYAERSAERGPEDWRLIVEALGALHADLAAAVRSGVRPGSEQANVLAERHRASMGAYFDCTHSMQVCLARSYVEDPGFRSFYDGIEQGLAEWLRDVVDANARAHGVDPATATWA